jgi:hypothetical protein
MSTNTEAYKVGYEYGYLKSPFGQRAKFKRGSADDYKKEQYNNYPSKLEDWQRGYNDFNKNILIAENELYRNDLPKFGPEGPFSFIYKTSGGRGKRTKKYRNKRRQSKKTKMQSKKRKMQSKKRKI